MSKRVRHFYKLSSIQSTLGDFFYESREKRKKKREIMIAMMRVLKLPV